MNAINIMQCYILFIVYEQHKMAISQGMHILLFIYKWRSMLAKVAYIF